MGATVDIYIEGLEVYGHHGVASEEKVLGQRLLYDVRLTMDECEAAETDDVADTVDYSEVLDVITEVATTQSFSLLERLAWATAEVPGRRGVGAGDKATPACRVCARQRGRCCGAAARRPRGLTAGYRGGHLGSGLLGAGFQPGRPGESA
jgi:dihydroneopterin aldolase